jgi:2-methylcitrate dehydratase PrpD
VGLAELTDEFVSKPSVRDLMPRVNITTDETPCPIEPIFARNDRVQLVLRDGKTLDSGEIRFARGNAMAPLAEPDLRAKFLDCAATAKDIDAAALYARLCDLRAVSRLRALA